MFATHVPENGPSAELWGASSQKWDCKTPSEQYDERQTLPHAPHVPLPPI